MNGVSVASESVAAATALAGLILVYMGGLASSFGTYQPQERRTVVTGYQRRVWIAFVGLILSLSAAALGVLGKWLPNECLADAAVVLLLIAFFWGAGIALLTAQEIR